MLNENKVKLMTKMAKYESTEGESDFRISSYYRKDYVGFHTLVTLIWVTVGYVIALGVGVIAFLEEILKHLNFAFIIMLAIGVVTGYLVLLLIYAVTAARFYKKKHEAARKRVKRFNYDLTRLNRMYEKEN